LIDIIHAEVAAEIDGDGVARVGGDGDPGDTRRGFGVGIGGGFLGFGEELVKGTSRSAHSTISCSKARTAPVKDMTRMIVPQRRPAARWSQKKVERSRRMRAGSGELEAENRKGTDEADGP
jgi:hypothetical protein